MNVDKLLLEIRKIVREEVAIASSSPTIVNKVIEKKTLAKKRPKNAKERAAIKEKLSQIDNVQTKLSREDKLKAKGLNEAQIDVYQKLNKNYTEVLKATGDIKKK